MEMVISNSQSLDFKRHTECDSTMKVFCAKPTKSIPVLSFKRLKEFVIEDGKYGIKKFKALSLPHRGVRKISLSFSEVCSIGAGAIKCLDLHGNSLAYLDGTDIPFPHLTNLRCSKNKIRNIFKFEIHHNLVKLDLSDNYLSDITSLAFTPLRYTLQSLELASNNISDFSGLAAICVFETLEELDISGNPIIEFGMAVEGFCLLGCCTLRYLSGKVVTDQIRGEVADWALGTSCGRAVARAVLWFRKLMEKGKMGERVQRKLASDAVVAANRASAEMERNENMDKDGIMPKYGSKYAKLSDEKPRTVRLSSASSEGLAVEDGNKTNDKVTRTTSDGIGDAQVRYSNEIYEGIKAQKSTCKGDEQSAEFKAQRLADSTKGERKIVPSEKRIQIVGIVSCDYSHSEHMEKHTNKQMKDVLCGGDGGYDEEDGNSMDEDAEDEIYLADIPTREQIIRESKRALEMSTNHMPVRHENSNGDENCSCSLCCRIISAGSRIAYYRYYHTPARVDTFCKTNRFRRLNSSVISEGICKVEKCSQVACPIRENVVTQTPKCWISPLSLPSTSISDHGEPVCQSSKKYTEVDEDMLQEENAVAGGNAQDEGHPQENDENYDEEKAQEYEKQHEQEEELQGEWQKDQEQQDDEQQDEEYDDQHDDEYDDQQDEEYDDQQVAFVDDSADGNEEEVVAAGEEGVYEMHKE